MLKHDWFIDCETLESNKKVPTEFSSIDESLKKQAIIEFLESAGFKKDYILQSLNKNLFNHIKACYNNLIKLLE